MALPVARRKQDAAQKACLKSVPRLSGSPEIDTKFCGIVPPGRDMLNEPHQSGCPTREAGRSRGGSIRLD
ncbi:MAG: hypothetical protein ACF8TS_18915 [Maioricimonas sp. JB049]